MRLDMERANALAIALREAGYPDHARSVRMVVSAYGGLPVTIGGPNGVMVVIRHAVSEGPPGMWVADLLAEDHSCTPIATEAGPIKAAPPASDAMQSHSLRIPAAMWAEMGRDGDRQEFIRAACEKELRARGRWPPRK